MSLLIAPEELAAAGVSVVPVCADGTKSPAVAWKLYTKTAATGRQIRDWFDGRTGIGIGIGCITGDASGNLEMLEVEGKGMSLMGDVLELLDEPPRRW